MTRRLPEVIHYTTITDEQAYWLGFERQDMGEFDSVNDLAGLEDALRSLGIEPCRLGHGRSLVADLLETNPPLLWNLNSGVFGATREAQVPALCEMLGIPLVGSGSWTAFVTQDKTLAVNWIRQNDVPVEVAESVTIFNADEMGKLHRLSFEWPYLVKPNYEGSSRGIDEAAVQFTHGGVERQVSRILREWGPVRIERYIDGFDVSANLACNPDGTLLPLVPVMVESETGVYDGGMKNLVEGSPKKSRRPLADYDAGLSNKAQKAALLVASCLRFRHYARVDLRCEISSGKLYFLEANVCPSFEPDDDYVFAAQVSGLTFPELLSNILTAAFTDALACRHLCEAPLKIRSAVQSELLLPGSSEQRRS